MITYRTLDSLSRRSRFSICCMSVGQFEEEDRSLYDHPKPFGGRQAAVVGKVEIELAGVVRGWVQLQEGRMHELSLAELRASCLVVRIRSQDARHGGKGGRGGHLARLLCCS